MSRYIDANAFKEDVKHHLSVLAYAGSHAIKLGTLEQWLDNAPSIDIEPKRGEWKKVKNVHAWDVSGVETWGVKRKCTNCDFRHTFIEDHGHYNFCPNCGARMKGADDEID